MAFHADNHYDECEVQNMNSCHFTALTTDKTGPSQKYSDNETWPRASLE